MANNLEALNGWLISYNALSDRWLAVKRDNAFDMFNDYDSKNVIKAVNFESLIAVICKTQGDTEKLRKLTENN